MTSEGALRRKDGHMSDFLAVGKCDNRSRRSAAELVRRDIYGFEKFVQ